MHVDKVADLHLSRDLTAVPTLGARGAGPAN
jgi:hypothetical protein